MPPHFITRHFCIPATLAVMVVLLVTFLTGCTTTATLSHYDEEHGAYLELDVEPKSAKIYIDGDYEGVVEGWHQQVVPVEPGERRLELRADGYIAQRFDLDVEEGHWLTLRARLEQAIEFPDEDQAPDEEEHEPMPAPDHPTAPEP